jgi:Cu/Ag efflux protein CusF
MIFNRSARLTLAALGAAAVLWTAAPASAQKPVTQGAQVSESFVIDAIDHTARLVTLRDDKGETETIFCGPEVERFDALKVGDKVTFRYYESMVYAIRKPGSAPAAGGSGVVRTPGDRPGGTISQQMTAVVTINAIDTKVPSVTITTSDGKKMSLKVEDAKNLQGVKVGDQVEITYTQALAISVTPPGK